MIHKDSPRGASPEEAETVAEVQVKPSAAAADGEGNIDDAIRELIVAKEKIHDAIIENMRNWSPEQFQDGGMMCTPRRREACVRDVKLYYDSVVQELGGRDLTKFGEHGVEDVYMEDFDEMADLFATLGVCTTFLVKQSIVYLKGLALQAAENCPSVQPEIARLFDAHITTLSEAVIS